MKAETTATVAASSPIARPVVSLLARKADGGLAVKSNVRAGAANEHSDKLR